MNRKYLLFILLFSLIFVNGCGRVNVTTSNKINVKECMGLEKYGQPYHSLGFECNSKEDCFNLMKLTGDDDWEDYADIKCSPSSYIPLDIGEGQISCSEDIDCFNYLYKEIDVPSWIYKMGMKCSKENICIILENYYAMQGRVK